MRLPPRHNREYMFNQLGWLTVNQLIVYHTSIMVYRIRQNKEPEYLADILGRTSRLGDNVIIAENIKLGLTRKSFTIRGAVQWNKLPSSLRSEPKLGLFKKSLKKCILENFPRFLT